jgi:hypothetical protein
MDMLAMTSDISCSLSWCSVAGQSLAEGGGR